MILLLLLACTDGGGALDLDHDGLPDDVEAELGTDPARRDTDRDGYGDGDELAWGSDPLDAASVIYTGGWPYNPRRDEPRGDPGAVATVGAPLLRASLVDQYGERVDLYDFGDQGQPVVVQVAGMWCAPCIELGRLFSGQPSELDAWGDAAAAVHAGRARWITVLAEDEDGAPADADDAARWAAAFPAPEIPVLVDDGSLRPWAASDGGLPAVWQLDPRLIVEDGGPGGADTRVLERLAALAP
jgi:hypothetical protein